MENIVQELRDANELLRSAYEIASRDGVNTNWDGFKKQLEKILIRQAELLNRSPILNHAVHTAKVFKLPMVDGEYVKD